MFSLDFLGDIEIHRYGLSDSQREWIKDLLSGRESHVGGITSNNRLFVEAVLFLYRAGIPWRDLHPGSETGSTSTGGCVAGVKAV